MNTEHKYTMMLLANSVRKGVNLPAHVFQERLSKYFFFDNDIRTSEFLIDATKTIVHQVFGDNVIAYVYSSSEFQYLASLSMSEEWVSKITLLSDNMNVNGDFGGLIILDCNKRWGVFQKTPVDEGVLGINSNINLTSINGLIYDNFIDCNIVSQWLKKKTLQDIELVQSLGEGYLKSLVMNYS